MYWRLDDLGNWLAIYLPSDPDGRRLLDSLLACDVLVLDDFLTTPITMDITSKLLNTLAAGKAKEPRSSPPNSAQSICTNHTTTL